MGSFLLQKDPKLNIFPKSELTKIHLIPRASLSTKLLRYAL